MPRTGTTWALRALVVPALLVLGLAACGSESADQAGNPPVGAQRGGVPAIAIGEPAAGTPAGDFLSTTVTEGGKPKKLVAGTKIAMTFTDGQVRASAGCNTMSGPARFENKTLIVTELAQTEMGCPGDGRYEQDQWVGTFLTARPTYTYDGKTLDLRTTDARIVLGPKETVQPDLPLAGTRWDVTHVTQGPARDAKDDPNAAVSAGMAPPNAYLEFADGKVHGSDGCNSLFGKATISGDTITFGPIGSTKKACPGVQGTDQLRAVLTGAVQWSIDHNVLQLENASGAGLQLQAAQNAEDLPLKTGASDPAVTPPCCKPLVGEGGASGSTGTGSAPTGVNPAGPADAPPGY
ncbi:MAG TPA: META domain-containing protein [Sporichthya sp.]|nr:META domain-containing protein [Sporichthya sp.]